MDSSTIRRIGPNTLELEIDVDHNDRMGAFPGYPWATADHRTDRVPRRTGKERVTVVLRCFRKRLGPDEPWELLGKEEIDPLIPEEHRDLYKATMNDPELPTPIASGGASWRHSDGYRRFFPYLGGDAGGRCLGLVWLCDDWDADWWFAARRKVPKP